MLTTTTSADYVVDVTVQKDRFQTLESHLGISSHDYVSPHASDDQEISSTSDFGTAQNRPFDVITALGDLPPDTLLTKQGLAEIFGLCTDSIRRAVERGELPPPTQVCGKSRWTVKSITNHIDALLEAAKEEAEAEAARLGRLMP